jgi:alpha-L-rhamnosidase
LIELRALDAWRREFLRPDGRTALDTQAAYVRAISFGLMPEGFRELAVERLVELIHKNDDHLGTGFLSTGMLLPVLADNGHGDLAYRLLTRTGVPSWLEVAERGGTTFWENWDGVGADGVARSGSLNHYSKGAVVEFLYTHILGLRQAPGSVGWRDFAVRPVFGGGLSAASGTHRTPHGDIRVSWCRDDGDVSVTVTAPVGTRGTVHVPGREPVVLEGGSSCTVRSATHDDNSDRTNARNEDV